MGNVIDFDSSKSSTVFTIPFDAIFVPLVAIIVLPATVEIDGVSEEADVY